MKTTSLPPCCGPTPLENLRLGLRVLAGELGFGVSDSLRGLEISRLRKRIRDEQERLPTLTDAEARAKSETLIAFLRDDIILLTNERARVRDDFVNRRKARLAGPVGPGSMSADR